MKTRYEYIDILKVIGMICIILAHVNPPFLIFQIRNFDVILMVLISAYLSIKSKNNNNIKYIYKRFKRLIVPTWIFITLFLILNSFTGYIEFSIKNIIGSYALSGVGIEYVWVIRIYFLIAILIYFINKINKKVKTSYLYVICILIFVLVELLYNVLCLNNQVFKYVLGYIPSCLIMILLSKPMFENKEKNNIIMIFSSITFIIYAVILYKQNNVFISTQDYKYPFRLYYLTYGVAVSSILIMIFKNKNICKLFSNKYIKFISSNSLWIYLWHIMIIYIIKPANLNWIISFFIIIITSILITYFQLEIIKILNKRKGEVK